MTYLVSTILLLINFILTILKGRGKFFTAILLVFMWVLFWGNNENPDYLNYKTLYDMVSYSGVGYSTSQIGFVLIMKFALLLGFEYHHFLMLISFVGMYLIYDTVKRYSNKPQLVFLLYFIHPFLLDVVQIKHFLAMSIVVYSFRYLEQEGISHSIRYVIGVFVAFSIHAISIVFLPIIFIKKVKINKLYKMVILVLLIGIPLVYTNFFQLVSSWFVDIQRVEHYFLDKPRFGFFIQFFIQGFIFLLVFYSKNVLERHQESNKFMDLIYRANLYLLILFPLYMINGNFERGFRMIMILNYIILSNFYSISKKKERLSILVLILTFVFLLFMYYIFMHNKDTVFFKIFENNMLFN